MKKTSRRKQKPIPGTGKGKSYTPGFTVRDFGSLGNHTRKHGWKTGRIHELASDGELAYFFVLEWSPTVVDIREQFPLPLEETLQIAKELGVKHPQLKGKTKEITTDFLVTYKADSGNRLKARTVKALKQLEHPKKGLRELEKLEIERRYWAARKVDWGIVTDRDIPTVLARNVERIHDAFFLESLEPLEKSQLPHVARSLTQRVKSEHRPLRDICSECDHDLGLSQIASQSSLSLAVARHLLATRQWVVDMREPLDWNRPLELKPTNQ